MKNMCLCLTFGLNTVILRLRVSGIGSNAREKDRIDMYILCAAVAKQWTNDKFHVTLVFWLFVMTFDAIDDLVLGYVFGSDFVISMVSHTFPPTIGRG